MKKEDDCEIVIVWFIRNGTIFVKSKWVLYRMINIKLHSSKHIISQRFLMSVNSVRPCILCLCFFVFAMEKLTKYSKIGAMHFLSWNLAESSIFFQHEFQDLKIAVGNTALTTGEVLNLARQIRVPFVDHVA